MPSPQQKSVHLSLRNDVAELTLVTGALNRIGEEIDIPAKALIQLQVALDEVLSNIVKYAWPPTEAHVFQVQISVRAGGMEVVILDDGVPFDPRMQSPPKPVAPDVRPRPGGVGIHMVKQLVDSFEYTRINGRNQVILTKQYSKQQWP
jgi:anti-sigma regulatory factor (Ser/Thr protein kinase)